MSGHAPGRSPIHQQMDTLPALVRASATPSDESARATFYFELCTSVKWIYLVGCRDSFYTTTGADSRFTNWSEPSTGGEFPDVQPGYV